MRRILAVAALSGALLAAAACGDDGGNGGDGGDTGAGGPTGAAGNLSNEEICAQGEEILTGFETATQEAGTAMVEAIAAGDEAAMAEAAASLTSQTSDLAEQLRDIAADAEDPELRSALEDFANELETVVEGIAADPAALDDLDTTALDDASARVEEFCPGTTG